MSEDLALKLIATEKCKQGAVRAVRFNGKTVIFLYRAKLHYSSDTSTRYWAGIFLSISIFLYVLSHGGGGGGGDIRWVPVNQVLKGVS